MSGIKLIIIFGHRCAGNYSTREYASREASLQINDGSHVREGGGGGIMLMANIILRQAS